MNEDLLKSIKDVCQSVDQLLALCLRTPEITIEILRSAGLAYEKSSDLWRSIRDEYDDDTVLPGCRTEVAGTSSVSSCSVYPDNSNSDRVGGEDYSGLYKNDVSRMFYTSYSERNEKDMFAYAKEHAASEQKKFKDAFFAC